MTDSNHPADKIDADVKGSKSIVLPGVQAVLSAPVVVGQSDVEDANLSILASRGRQQVEDIREEAGPSVSSESLI